jgi:hydrogenase maturation protein HypF
MNGIPVEVISTKFHLTVVNIICDIVERITKTTGLKKVMLSGGTWQNPYLFRKTEIALRNKGYEVFYHRQVPANDGGIALGQAMIAHWRRLKSSVG